MGRITPRRSGTNYPRARTIAVVGCVLLVAMAGVASGEYGAASAGPADVQQPADADGPSATAPANDTDTPKVDVVFVVDASSSMENNRYQLLQEIHAFEERIGNGTDARYALFTYTDSTVLQQPLTQEFEAVVRALGEETEMAGSYERASDAILSALEMETRPDAETVVVLATDEDDDSPAVRREEAVDALKDATFVSVSMADPAVSSCAHHSEPCDNETANELRTIADDADGQWLDVRSDPTDIVAQLGEITQSAAADEPVVVTRVTQNSSAVVSTTVTNARAGEPVTIPLPWTAATQASGNVTNITITPTRNGSFDVELRERPRPPNGTAPTSNDIPPVSYYALNTSLDGDEIATVTFEYTTAAGEVGVYRYAPDDSAWTALDRRPVRNSSDRALATYTPEIDTDVNETSRPLAPMAGWQLRPTDGGVGDRSVELIWNGNIGPDTFQVQELTTNQTRTFNRTGAVFDGLEPNGTYRFRVRSVAGTTPAGEYGPSAWSEPVEVTNKDPEDVEAKPESRMTPVGVFAVERRAPAFEATSFELANRSIAVGDVANATLTVENHGNANGTYAAALAVNGTEYVKAAVQVPANESRVLRLPYRSDRAGTFTLRAAGHDATLTVEANADSDSD